MNVIVGLASFLLLVHAVHAHIPDLSELPEIPNDNAQTDESTAAQTDESTAAPTDESTTATKPNFIIMLMDDMGWGDLGVLGNPSFETPNIDEMAREGMLMMDFYSACPVCSPSRASVMTGRLPVRNGFYTDSLPARNAYAPPDIEGGIQFSEVLLPEILGQNGYRSKIIGKWHLGHRDQYLPLRHGFDEFFGSPNLHYGPYDNIEHPNIPVFKDAEMVGRYHEGLYSFDEETKESNITQYFIGEATSFIEQQAAKQEPFFLYWAADATHFPLFASKSFLGTSDRGLYGDVVRELDFGVGEIMSTLQSLGIGENTFVFFSSDNGAAIYWKTEGGSTGPFLCGKETTFEGGQRVPGVAWWPGKIQAGTVSKQVGNLMDLYLTFLDITGIPVPSNVTFDGISLKETFLNNAEVDRPQFYYRGNLLMAVRVGQYKAHFHTWSNNLDEIADIDWDFCFGDAVEGVTTHDLTNRTADPILFHLGRDPGEKAPIDPSSDIYKRELPKILQVAEAHKAEVVFAEPQLNWVDIAVEPWAPPGCQKLSQCLPVPPSDRKRHYWRH